MPSTRYLVCAWEWSTAQRPVSDGVALGWALVAPLLNNDRASFSAFRLKHAHLDPTGQPMVWGVQGDPAVRRRDEIVVAYA